MLINTGPKNGGYFNPNTPDTYYADSTDGGDIVFNHEFYHMYDLRHNGFDSERDSSFTSLNPRKIYGKGNQGQYISVDGYKKFKNKHVNEFNIAVASNNKTEQDRLQNLYDQEAALVVTRSDYGFTDVLEDKAEIGRTFFEPSDMYNLFNPKMPILRQKSLFLLARLYHDNPRIVRYLLDIQV